MEMCNSWCWGNLVFILKHYSPNIKNEKKCTHTFVPDCVKVVL